jgi:signal transduction histidine kinase
MRGETDGSITTRDVVAMVIALLAIAARRWRPRLDLVVTAVATAVLLLTTDAQQPVLVVALGIVTFTMASRTDRRAGMVVAGPVAAGLYFVVAYVNTGSVWSPQSFGAIAWIGMTAAAGDAIRSRRAYVAEVEERARRAEQTRESEAASRVIQERVRIARELHDVVAHHIAVINVQAGAASHVLTRHPDQADRALTHIRDACDTVLSELASIVGVLRQSDDDATTEPVRGLTRLTDMVDSLAAAGLTVERTQLGQARELPAVVDLAAYRIVQEALTNAHKYGTGTARLTITYTADAITLDVVNSVAAGRAPVSSGYGILGMRERAATAGGTLDAQARPDGRFTVHAELPAPALKAAL